MSGDREKYVNAYVQALKDLVSVSEGDQFIIQLNSVMQKIENQESLIAALASRRLPENFEQQLLQMLTQDDLLQVQNLLQVVVQNGHIKILRQILSKFEEMQDARQNRMRFTARVPYLPPQKQQDQIAKVLESRFKLQQVQVNYQIDQDLIGGIILKSKQYLIDDSLRTRLNRIRDSLLEMKISRKELEA